MKIVMISSFPPTKCGIGAYADQHARKLESQGHEVKRWDIHVLNRQKWRSALVAELEFDIRNSDKVILQYQPSLLRSTHGLPLLKSLVPYWRLTNALVGNSKFFEIVVHEDFAPVTKIFTGIQKKAARRLFGMADIATFHTQVEAYRFSIPVIAKNVVPADAHYVKKTTKTKVEARDFLGIGQESVVFVTAGFYHPGKGYERLVKAFYGMSLENQLYVVTSDREGRFTSEMGALRSAVDSCPGNIHLVDQYVSDEEFDDWIQASDFVVVPYTSGFASSILARANLYDKPCLVARLPALQEQGDGLSALGRKKDYLYFQTDSDLRALLHQVTT